jgi:hypothetical protein
MERELLIAGFKKIPFTSRDVLELYSGLKHAINEPWTYIRNSAIVQIIRPRLPNYSAGFPAMAEPPNKPENIMMELLRNVDISACGVYYDGKEKILETCTDAIADCLKKQFTVNDKAAMFQRNRIDIRTHKLEERGWKNATPIRYVSPGTYIRNNINGQSLRPHQVAVRN